VQESVGQVELPEQVVVHELPLWQVPFVQLKPVLHVEPLQHDCPLPPHWADPTQVPFVQLKPALHVEPLQHDCPLPPH
jgi:hypothetical protein